MRAYFVEMFGDSFVTVWNVGHFSIEVIFKTSNYGLMKTLNFVKKSIYSKNIKDFQNLFKFLEVFFRKD
jgi:hypothetical protein